MRRLLDGHALEGVGDLGVADEEDGAGTACAYLVLHHLRLLEERHRVAATLQAAMLTELPPVPAS